MLTLPPCDRRFVFSPLLREVRPLKGSPRQLAFGRSGVGCFLVSLGLFDARSQFMVRRIGVPELTL